MNILDVLVYAVILVSVAAGLYQGLIATSANTAGFFLSVLCAGWFYGGMAARVKAAGAVIRSLIYYSESSDMLGTVEVYRTPAAGMTQQNLDALLQNVSLPHPIGEWFERNVLGGVYAGEGIANLGEYLSQTVAEAAVSVASFLIVFLTMYAIVTVAINMLHFVAKLPSLKAFDGALGGVVGLLRGVMLAYVLCMALPVVLSMLPVQQVRDIVDTSRTAGMFYENNFLFGLIRSYIP